MQCPAPEKYEETLQQSQHCFGLIGIDVGEVINNSCGPSPFREQSEANEWFNTPNERQTVANDGAK